MGNLHAGHIALVDIARRHGRCVVASIFVNRLQFDPGGDFDRYPRTLQSDCEKLERSGADVVFAPDEREMYPQPQAFKVVPDPALADILEGHFRPGFFVGVCTVVMKLFQCVQPSVTVFGKKDFQQIMVLRHMIHQFAMPIEMIASDTHRADNGLALSSRNGFLSPEQLTEAVQLSLALKSLIAQVKAGNTHYTALEAQAMGLLAARGWQPDYLTIRRKTDLQTPALGDAPASLVVLGAAKLGTTRLIDNWEIV